MWNLFIYLIPISFTESKRGKGKEKEIFEIMSTILSTACDEEPW